MSITIKVEHEITPLRRAEMICPECGHTIDLMNPKEALTQNFTRINDDVDLKFMKVGCKNCGLQINTRGIDLEIMGFQEET